MRRFEFENGRLAVIWAVFFGAVFGGFWHRHPNSGAYRSHNANFLMNCPEDKRLVLEDMDCGWQVICDFVKRPVPEVEYPHKNKTGTGEQINQLMMGRTEKIYREHYGRFKVKVLVVGVGCFLIYNRDQIKTVFTC